MQILAGATTLEVEVDGPDQGEPLLLIMGLGMQLIAWPEGLVEQLVGRGFRVIRFDNRDAGRSQRFDALNTPHPMWQGLRYALHMPLQAPYTLSDMADDARALLDALDIRAAHVCGASMGGMIAQHLAACAPARVKSLTLMMSSSGARSLPGPKAAARLAFLGRPVTPTPEAMLAHYLRLFQAIGSPAYPTPEATLRATILRGLQRGGLDAGAGVARQLAAIGADGDRTPMLASLTTPTQVIHGQSDPLLPLAHGRQLAQAIRHARLEAVPGMGHDLPAPLWPLFADCIESASRRAA
jgi:pimeloyl-ACP methyl ester carboxylesterase